MEKKILIFTMMKNLRKHLRLILAVTFLSVITVWLLLSFFLVQQHQSTSQILVKEITASNAPMEVSSMKTDPQVTEAYSIIIKSPDILAKVISSLGLETSVNELYDDISVSKAMNSQVLNITAARMTEEEAAEIVNALAIVVQQEIPAIMGVDNIDIISTAAVETGSSEMMENLLFDLGLAGAFGLVVGILIAFIIDLLNVLFKPGNRDKREKNAELQTVFK